LTRESHGGDIAPFVSGFNPHASTLLEPEWLRDSAAIRYQCRGRDFAPGNRPTFSRAKALECRLCAAVATSCRWTLWRKPQPVAALLSVSSALEAKSTQYDLYLGSLEAIGIDMDLHDIRFVEDDWENPTVGAWGLGWEVWCDGMEVSQFTYFQQVGGLDVDMVSGELTYGLERLAMYVQGVESVYDLRFNNDGLTYGEVFHQNEVQQSAYNFEHADVDRLQRWFKDAEEQCQALLALEKPLPLPAYEYALKASHFFNLLDARGVISPTERASFIKRVRDLAKGSAQAWVECEKQLMAEAE